MTYEEALNYIHSKLRFGSKPGLERIGKLCELLGNPQDSLKFVHIAGTNGKGSTAAMTSSVLTRAGYKTGLYISPFILDFRERMSIDGEYISRDELTSVTEKVMFYAEGMAQSPTEFELVTAAAFLYYKEQNCDIVVLETGLGGRFDATNIIKPPVCSVITKISYDHTEYLGDTIDKIAFEKCGIIKRDSAVISYPLQDKNALAVIKSRANEENSKFILPDVNLLRINKGDIFGLDLDYKSLNINLSLAGEHQAYNCITALEALFALRNNNFKITDDDIKMGMSRVKFPARLEIISKKPLIILDGAHNPDGIGALAKNIDILMKDKEIHLVMGMLKDKAYKECLSLIVPKCVSFTAVTPENPRALPARELSKEAMEFCKDVSFFEDYSKAVQNALKKAGEDGIVLICGSLYMAGKMCEAVREITGQEI